MSAKSLLLKVIRENYCNGDIDVVWAEEYAEKGYHAPEHGILFANWNPKKFDGLRSSQTWESRVGELIEKTGLEIECEWSDEWTTCSDCSKAVRTSPNSYSWLPSYLLVNECEIICHECMDDDNLEVYLMNNPSRADIWGRDWESRGWKQFEPESGDFASGWYERSDNPKDICKQVKNDDNFLFEITGTGQFESRFIMWVRAYDYEQETD